MVRNPVDRLVSVFRYQRDVERTIPLKRTLMDWLGELEVMLIHRNFAFDNHIRPMTEIVPQDARVFRLEDGTEAIVDWLDELAGDKDGARVIRTSNSYNQRIMQKRRKPRPRPVPTRRQYARIAKLYAADFERFGYDIKGSD